MSGILDYKRELQVNIQNQSKRTLPVLMSASGKASAGKMTLSFSSKMAPRLKTLVGRFAYEDFAIDRQWQRSAVEGSFDLKAGTRTGTEPPTSTWHAIKKKRGDDLCLDLPGGATDLELTITPQEAFVYSLSCESLTPRATISIISTPVFTRVSGILPLTGRRM